jgi:UDP-N-acetylmuramoyl-tripeptide--D-alanyl-D-alanine ligase
MSRILAGAGARFRARQLRSLERKALRVRERSRADFVGITGSSAKSTTAALLAHILRARGRVREQVKFNDLKALLKALARAPWNCDFMVVEAAVAWPGHMKPMAGVLRPNAAVVTLIGLEHKSAFSTLEAIAAEKGELVAAVVPGGFAMLNADDPHAMAMAALTRERVLTFGRSEGADFRAVDVRAAFPDRLRLTLVWGGGSLPLATRFAGEHFWLPTLAAAATAIELGTPPNLIAQRVANFEPLLERCGVISVPGGPHFIVDTTKAPWHSVKLAFDMVGSASAPRKRIVLGHMSDFAGSDQKYRDAYHSARAAADQVVFVGQHAHRSKASRQDRDEGRFVAFTTPEQAAEHIRRTAVPGEVILLKGSVDLHLERIALSWVKDVKCWVTACGHNSGCVDCGRYGESYEWHKGRKKRGRLKRHLRRLLANWSSFRRRSPTARASP